MNKLPFNWRLFILLSAGIIAAIICLLIFRIVTDSPPKPPKHDDSLKTQTTKEPKVDVEAVQNEAWRRIQPRLADADERTYKATNTLIGRI